MRVCVVCASPLFSMPPRPPGGGGGGGAAVRPLIGLLFFFGPHAVSAAYTCTALGTECANRDYSSGSYGSEAAVEAECDADVSCIAYDWSTNGLGFKCSSAVTRNDEHGEFKMCTKPSKNHTRTTIARAHPTSHLLPSRAQVRRPRPHPRRSPRRRRPPRRHRPRRRRPDHRPHRHRPRLLRPDHRPRHRRPARRPRRRRPRRRRTPTSSRARAPRPSPTRRWSSLATARFRLV